MQWQAVEADLLDRGFTYADIGSRVSWRAVNAMVRHSRRGSALFGVVFGEVAEWGPMEHLMATLVDVQQLLLWLKTQDGADGKNRPVLVRRPGHAAPEDHDSERLGSADDAILISDWNEWWSADAPIDREVVTDGN